MGRFVFSVDGQAIGSAGAIPYFDDLVRAQRDAATSREAKDVLDLDDELRKWADTKRRVPNEWFDITVTRDAISLRFRGASLEPHARDAGNRATLQYRSVEVA